MRRAPQPLQRLLSSGFGTSAESFQHARAENHVSTLKNIEPLHVRAAAPRQPPSA